MKLLQEDLCKMKQVQAEAVQSNILPLATAIFQTFMDSQFVIILHPL